MLRAAVRAAATSGVGVGTGVALGVAEVDVGLETLLVAEVVPQPTKATRAANSSRAPMNFIMPTIASSHRNCRKVPGLRSGRDRCRPHLACAIETRALHAGGTAAQPVCYEPFAAIARQKGALVGREFEQATQWPGRNGSATINPRATCYAPATSLGKHRPTVFDPILARDPQLAASLLTHKATRALQLGGTLMDSQLRINRSATIAEPCLKLSKACISASRP
jgi:hypothetical protein